ncbi:U32 family peptidase [Saccharicrinis sp. FJH2]|uniref:U32 family peptidase n=1 Tax=Saccharicrinis sp. FJH65 TaxID=3344659 RepID=UPI0035F2DEEE
MAIRFDIPMLFRREYIDGLAGLEKEELVQIGSVYGAIQKSVIGQARFSKKIPQLDHQELAHFVKKVHDLGIEFHYTLNSPWNGMLERYTENRNDIKTEISSIIGTGIDALVLANPYLIAFVKDNWPELKIIGSINLQTATAYRFNKLLKDGCHRVVLDRTVNRNIRFLKMLKIQGQNYSLLVNSTCLFDCPLQQYHANENGALSSGSDLNVIDTEFCLKYCISAFNQQKENFLKATWIRPEDLSLYENIGVKNLKIQGRTLEPKILLDLIRAYLNRSTPNDSLFYIFPGFEKQFPEISDKLKNSSLDKIGFVESFFSTERNCSELCFTCDYCTNTFKKI